MLAHILGIVFLIVGGIVGIAILLGAVGFFLDVVWFAIKLALPLLLIYLGYRLVRRRRDAIAY